jgi:nitroreductase
MDVFQAISQRYSCRSYKDKPIAGEKIARLLEAARLAPSASNFQDWRFVVVTDPQTKELLVTAANNQKMLAQAPVVIVACSVSSYRMRCGQTIGPIDVSIALEHIALQAVEEGLATCWIGSFYHDKVRALLDIPQGIDIVELMVVGYPADTKPESKREPIENIVCYDKWKF